MTDDGSPLVSVVLPVHDRASLVERAVRSVLSQSYGNLELIVVDDASTDRTHQVVSGIDDPRLRCLRHERNRGGSAARNTGIAAARGQFVAFQDSDDAWTEEKLRRQVDALRGAPGEVGIVYSAYVRHAGGRHEVLPARDGGARSGDLRHALLTGNVVATPTVLARRTCLEHAGGFDESLPRLQDWDLWIRVARTHHFHFLPEPLVDVYVTAGAISSNQRALLEAQRRILEKHYALFEEAGPEALGLQLWQVGHLHCLLGDTATGRTYIARSVAQSRNLRNSLGLLLARTNAGAYAGAVDAGRALKRAMRPGGGA